MYHDGEAKRPKLAPEATRDVEDGGDDFHKGVEIGGCLGAGELVPYPDTQALTQQVIRREWEMTQFQTQSPCKILQEDQNQSLASFLLQP